jgi:Concanavalin A-like lectin/glucanases superfamily
MMNSNHNQLGRLEVGASRNMARFKTAILAAALWLIAATPGHAVSLEHRYSFTGNANDSVGSANLSLQGAASVGPTMLTTSNANAGSRNDGAFATGSALTELAGTINGASAVTIEGWFTQNQANNWSKLLMTGTDTGLYMDMTPRRGADGNVSSASINDSTHGENNVKAIGFGPLNNGTPYYMAATWDTNSDLMKVKLGPVGGALSTFNAPMGGQQLSNVGINQFYLGSAVGFGDPDFDGSIDELRVWNGALPSAQLAANFAAGPNTLAAPVAPNAPVALWKASNFAGGDWVDSVSGIHATPGGNPTPLGAAGVLFNGVNDEFSVSPADNPIAGLNDFTVTAIFRADGTLGEGGGTRAGGDGGAFWQVAHLVGIELPGAGVGDWGIGLGADENIQAGVGLQGDQSVEITNGAPFNDGDFHISTMVMDAQNDLLKVFVDGSLEATLNVTPNNVVNSGFFMGTNGAPSGNDIAFYHGRLIEVGFHDYALSDDEVLAIHRAGTLMTMPGVPEPTTVVLVLGAAMVGLGRRRRAAA